MYSSALIFGIRYTLKEEKRKNMKVHISTKEASALVGVSPTTFKRYAREHKYRKKLDIYRFTHKNVRYCRDSVIAFIEANKSVRANH